jgi:serine/threonine protein phosphatase 1
MGSRFYIVGDIHGYLSKLKKIITSIKNEIKNNDSIIFLGDYIDRGPSSFEVIEYLIGLSTMYKTVFLMGNHEDMFITYFTTGENYYNYMRNGGGNTIKSYIKNLNEFTIPESHLEFLKKLKLYYEGDDFIAVHGGLNPGINTIHAQKKHDLIWIREEFYTYKGRWTKTVIFGHTPTPYLHHSDSVYIDEAKNIIGLDTGAMTEGYPLTCMRWPDRKIYQAY